MDINCKTGIKLASGAMALIVSVHGHNDNHGGQVELNGWDELPTVAA